MIVNKQSGVMVAGPLAKDPEIKETRTGKQFLSMSVKAHSVKDDSGKWNSVFVECCIWRDWERWDGLLHKGDFVVAFGQKLEHHESNGKTYWNLNAEGVVVGGLVNASWVQTAIDMIPAGQAEPMHPTDELTPFDVPPPQPVQTSLDGGQMYPGECLADYAPQRTAPAVGTPEADALINDDADDLPF